jgi:hypothetical protein
MKGRVVVIDFLAGTSIDEAATKMVAKASEYFCPVESSFNGFPLKAFPQTNPINISKEYRAFCQRKSNEYRNSPEGKRVEAEIKSKKLDALSALPKEFPIEVVLSVVTGRLLTKPGAGGSQNGIYAMYEFIEHCLASSCMDITAPKMATVLKPMLLEQFPELAIASSKLPDLDQFLSSATISHSMVIEAWISRLDLPSSYIVPVCVYE